jgi:hypothetical protein
MAFWLSHLVSLIRREVPGGRADGGTDTLPMQRSRIADPMCVFANWYLPTYLPASPSAICPRELLDKFTICAIIPS